MKQHHSAQRRGAATVEMALATPILLTIVVGLMEICHAFMVQHLMQDAARRGCRTAVCSPVTNSDVVSTVTQLLKAEAISNATTSILINDVAGDISQAKSGDSITVKITVPAADISIIPTTGYLTGRLSASATRLHQ